MTLSELQLLFWRAARGEAPPDAVRQAFVTRDPLDAVARLQIYGRMYAVRQEQALCDGFPRLAGLLGARFASLARAYLRQYPSRSPLIERVGHRFEAFLRDSGQSTLLADLAALEWARTEGFLAPDSSSTARAQDVCPATFADSTLSFVPSLRAITVARGALDLWLGAELAGVEHGPPTSVRVFRKGFGVFHRTMAADEAKALELATSGAALASVCAVFGDDQQAASAAFRVIASWMNDELISEIRAPRCS